MKKTLTVIALFFSFAINAQLNYQSLDTVKASSSYENIFVRPLYKDSSDVSSFIIFVKQEVKMHKHVDHAEHVIVLAGNGEMTLGEATFPVKKGDVIFIPKNTFHGVRAIGKIPLKVLSVQAPFFDGKDRVIKN